MVAPPPAKASMVHPAYASSSKAASSWEPFPGAAAAATRACEPTPVNEPAPAYEPTLNQATDDHNPEFPTTAFDLLTSIGHPRLSLLLRWLRNHSHYRHGRRRRRK